MNRTLVAVGCVGLTLLFNTIDLCAATPPAITHTAIPCVPNSGGHAKIIATITGAESARVYFRASQSSREFYVDMLKDAAGAYWAPLPLPSNQTKGVIYHIVAKGKGGETSSTTNYNVPVSNSCAPYKFSDSEAQAAKNMIVGWTDGMDSFEGFRCQDVGNRINQKGQMQRWDGCIGAGAGAGAAGSGSKIGAFSTKTLLIVGAAATATGAGYIAWRRHHDHHRHPRSPSRP